MSGYTIRGLKWGLNMAKISTAVSTGYNRVKEWIARPFRKGQKLIFLQNRDMTHGTIMKMDNQAWTESLKKSLNADVIELNRLKVKYEKDHKTIKMIDAAIKNVTQCDVMELKPKGLFRNEYITRKLMTTKELMEK